MLREARAIIEQGLVERVILLGFWKDGVKQEELVTGQITIKRILSIGKSKTNKWLNIPAFALFYWKVLRFCIARKPNIVNAHSLTVLPLAIVIKWITRARVIYDPHELETETNDSRGSRKALAKFAEKSLIKSVDYTVVVGHHIADWYKTAYGLNVVEVIRNIPENHRVSFTGDNMLREKLGIGADKIVYLYLGVLIRGRGIDIILEAFKNADDMHHVVFVGFGEYEKLLVNESKQWNNIHYLPGVEPEKVLRLTSGADVGLSLIENTSLSYYFCLPNKVFEYLWAGIPFIASDFPELRREFGAEEFCWLIYPDKEALLATLKSIDRDSVRERKSKALDRRSHWSWEVEKEKYRFVYESLNNG